MVALLRRCRTLLTVYYANMMEYRAELYLWVLAGLLPFIMMGVWLKAAQSPGNITGLSPAEMVRYFLCVFLVRQLTIVWVIWDFEHHVLSGRLSPYLLQPLDPVWRFIATHLSEQAARLPFSIVIMAGVLAVYPQAFAWPGWKQVVVAFGAIYLSFTMRFLMQYSVAMLCFWFERAAGVEAMIYLPYLFLSGSVAPLTAFPPGLRTVALLTPFPYLVYFPAQVLCGFDRGWHIPEAQGFAVLGIWTAFFFFLSRLLWRRGLKHYSAMGA